MKPTKANLAKVFRYLDELRDSGSTNMFGAGQYLMEEFALTRKEASGFLSMWMKTFGEGTPSERAKKALADA